MCVLNYPSFCFANLERFNNLVFIRNQKLRLVKNFILYNYIQNFIFKREFNLLLIIISFQISQFLVKKSFKEIKSVLLKELSLCHKLKFSNPYIFAILKCISLIFQTQIISSNIIHSLKYLRSVSLGCKDIENQSLWQKLNSFKVLLATDGILISTVHSFLTK